MASRISGELGKNSRARLNPLLVALGSEVGVSSGSGVLVLTGTKVLVLTGSEVLTLSDSVVPTPSRSEVHAITSRTTSPSENFQDIVEM